MENYPVVSIILAYGKPLAAGLAALLPLGALLMVFCGWSWLLLPVGVGLGLIVFGLLLSYVEIIRIIADTLLPK